VINCKHVGRAPPFYPPPPPSPVSRGVLGMAGLLVPVPCKEEVKQQEEDKEGMPCVPPNRWIVDTGSARSITPFKSCSMTSRLMLSQCP
jgi:hypothetical protein